MESMRMATIVPNALPHTALEDIQVNGYVIPKVSLESIILQKKKNKIRVIRVNIVSVVRVVLQIF